VADAGDATVDAADGGGVCENAPNSFNLLTPSDTATNISLYTRFVWRRATDNDPGDAVTYTLIVSENQDLSNPVVDQPGIVETEYVLTSALDAGRTYYWKVVAEDSCDPPQETESAAVFSFTTVAQCINPPGAFSLLSPADGAPNVSITPTLDVTDATDLDLPQDSLTYRFEIDTDSAFPNPMVFYGQLNQSTYTLDASDALNHGTPYFWRSFVVDGCNNEVASNQAYWSFTTEYQCFPQSYYDTDFLSGTTSDATVISGTVSLIKDNNAWTCYDGSVFPEVAGWTENAPSSWTTKAISSGVLHLSSIDVNDIARYELDPSFSGSGWMLETRMQLVNSQGTNACAIDIRDGSHAIDFRIQNTQVRENITVEFYTMDPTLDFNTYRIVKQGVSYSIYVNDILRINGTAFADASPSHLWFHDIGGNNDSEAYWDYICWYNGGSSLPYVGSGRYTSEIVNTGTTNNNIGSGAVLRWTQNTPAGTSIEMQFCASNDPGLAGAACASGLTTNTGEIIPAGVQGQYFQVEALLGTTDVQNTSELYDVTVNYETCN
jgi:hypothetical protein